MNNTKKTLFGALALTALVGVGVGSALTANATQDSTHEPTSEIAFISGECTAIRMDDPTGIRFGATVSDALEAQLLDGTAYKTGAEAGLIIVPNFVFEAYNAQETEGKEVDYFAFVLAKYGKEKAEVSRAFLPKVLAETSATDKVTGSIVELQDANYNEAYSAVAYYTLDGENYVYSAVSEAKTVTNVADSALLDTTTQYEADERIALGNIIEKASSLKNGGTATAFATYEVKKGDKIDLKAKYASEVNATDIAYTLNGEAIDGNYTATVCGVNELKITAYNGAMEMNIPLSVYAEVDGDVMHGLSLDTIKQELGVTGDITVSQNGNAVASTEGTIAYTTVDVTFSEGVSGSVASPKTYTVTAGEAEYKVLVNVWSALIGTADELCSAHEYEVKGSTVHGYYKLTADIDMDEATDTAWATNWTPIADGAHQAYNGGFRGIFDGQNHVISNFVSAGQYKALIRSTSDKALVQNVVFENAVMKGALQSGIIVALNAGGTFDNIDVELTLEANGYANNAPGVFGRLDWASSYASDLAYNYIKISNTTITAKDTATGTRTYASAIGYKHDGLLPASHLILKNVELFGFNNVLETRIDGTDKVISTLGELETQATCTNVNIWGSKLDKINQTATKLTAVETDVANGATVDFADKLPAGKTLAKVYDSELNALTGTSVTFTWTDASNVVKAYVLEDTDGDYYTIDVTVWTRLIADEAGMLAMQDDLEKNIIYRSIYVEDNNANSILTTPTGGNAAFYGYFKLIDDITMTTTWTKTMAGAPKVAPETGSTAYAQQYKAVGFRGVFDGNNKKITNFTVSGADAGLFGVIGKGAVIKNVTFENVTFAGVTGTTQRTGLLGAYATACTVENVNISYNAVTVECYGVGALFGNTNEGGNGAVYSETTTLNNVAVTMVEKDGVDNTKSYVTLCGKVQLLSTMFNIIGTVTFEGKALYTSTWSSEGYVTEYTGITLVTPTASAE